MLPLLAAIPSILDIGGKVIDKIFPDKEKAEEMKLKLLEMQQAGELKELEALTQVDLAQLEVNKIEAQSESLFKSGWRPAFGWIGVAGFFYNFVGGPTLTYVTNIINSIVLYTVANPSKWHAVTVPGPLDLSEIAPIVIGMLGLGVYRTVEKIRKAN